MTPLCHSLLGRNEAFESFDQPLWEDTAVNTSMVQLSRRAVVILEKDGSVHPDCSPRDDKGCRDAWASRSSREPALGRRSGDRSQAKMLDISPLDLPRLSLPTTSALTSTSPRSHPKHECSAVDSSYSTRAIATPKYRDDDLIERFQCPPCLLSVERTITPSAPEAQPFD